MTFDKVLVLILRKGVKSLQLMLNEFTRVLDIEPVTASAFSQARQNLSHTAFIELNDIIAKGYYEDGDYETYKGHRLLAMDGSSIRLPNTSEIRAEFGSVPTKNCYTEGEYAEAKASVLYDVLNKIALHSVLDRCRRFDTQVAKEHYDKLAVDDIVILDRAYASYEVMSAIFQRGSHFLIRCPRRKFNDAQGLFTAKNVRSRVAHLKRQHWHDKGSLKEIAVRFVQVRLPKGEIEVLVTSLIDEKTYPTADFKTLYKQRWKIETFYDLIKTRLSIEHFTGKTIEAVKQDFYSTIFITVLETICTEDIDQELASKCDSTMHQQKVNKAVSFNTIKHHVWEILSGPEPENLEKKLAQLFMTNRTLIRQKRKTLRKQKANYRQRTHYYRTQKKVVF